MIDDRFKYKELEENLAQEINAQGKSILEDSVECKPIYDEDVEIIIKDGKCFFLHETPNIKE